MLTWYDPLYVGPKAAGDVRKMRKKLDRRKRDSGHYLITFASNGVDELDIIHSGFLSSESVYDHLPMIVGVAADKQEALSVAGRIIEDCIRYTGDTRVRAFLQEDFHDGTRGTA